MQCDYALQGQARAAGVHLPERGVEPRDRHLRAGVRHRLQDPRDGLARAKDTGGHNILFCYGVN